MVDNDYSRNSMKKVIELCGCARNEAVFMIKI
jgi:hypothetical protein